MERTVWRRILVHPLSIQQTKHIKYTEKNVTNNPILFTCCRQHQHFSISIYIFKHFDICLLHHSQPTLSSILLRTRFCSITRCQVWECGKMWCPSNIIFSIFLIDLVYIFMGRVQQHWLFMFHTVDRCRKPATASTYQYLLLCKDRKQENLIQQK